MPCDSKTSAFSIIDMFLQISMPHLKYIDTYMGNI